MLRRRLVVFALALLVAVARGRRAAAPPEAKDGWRPVESAPGGFRASFPGAPREREQQAGKSPRSHMVNYLTLDRTPFGRLEVRWSDFEDGLPDAAPVVEQLCKRPFTHTQFTMQTGQARTLHGHSGYVTTGVAPPSDRLPDGGYTEHRCLLAGPRLFQVSAIVAGTPEARAEATRFLDSFALSP
jgi:hypothetical protein